MSRERPSFRPPRGFAARLPGPLGCLAAVVLFPFVVLGTLIMGLFVRRKVAQVTEEMGRVPRTPQEMEREVALCSLVRSLGLEADLSRAEALAMPVIVSSGAAPPAEELLDGAIRRGWVRAVQGDRVAVTPTGREAAERFLDARHV